MGFLGNLLGTNSLNHNFNYTPSTASYTPNNAVNQSMANLNNASRNMMSQAQDLMEGRGTIMEAYQNQLSERMANQTAAQSMQMNKQLAQRGMGTGGLANLVNAGMQNRAGEQLSQGMVGLMGQGAQMGQSLMGMGMQGFGQASQLASQTDQRALQQAMFNAQQQNEQRQYTMTSRYNQSAGNRAARGEFAGNVIGAAGSIAASAAPFLIMSDIRLKNNIDNVGVSESGVNIYEFNYNDKEGRYRGVMAQEVPWASEKHNGYLHVDYSKLDVNFERIG
tara:strand:+ start:195 stop:1028 length:834 start_codon:yes stop_codon:yes gene_type:complete